MDNYNIDDILSEVKKRKLEETGDIPETDAEPQTEDAAHSDAPQNGENESFALSDDAMDEVMGRSNPEESAAEPEEDKMVNLFELAEEADEDEFAQAEAVFEEKQPETDAVPPVAPAETTGKNKKNPKSKTRKVLTAIIAVLIALIFIGAAVFFITANGWINEIVKNSADDNAVTASTEEWQGMKQLVENFDPIKETEATELASLEDMIGTWYHNGTPCSSTHVLNVLLIGEDTRGKKILDEGTRADSAIIASINVDTGKVTLTSILRDAWGYWETENGNEDTGQFGKINGAMSLGDINCYKRTIEQLYKIKLDGHAIVNFTSFESIVNALGGVELELTAKEITEINSHPKTYGDVWITKKFDGEKGIQKLNGRQALAYCRIRHIDSDNARADRQKICLIKIFEQTKGASKTKMLKVMKKLIPYVKTSFGKNEMVKIATYALSEGWIDYDVETTNIPEMNLKGGTFKPDFGGQWIWRADFPADAYMLQKRIYGKSSITLAKERVNTKTVRQSGIYKDGARATTETYTNEHYGEESTLPPTTEEDDEGDTDEINTEKTTDEE